MVRLTQTVYFSVNEMNTMTHAFIYLHCTCCNTRLTVSISTSHCTDEISTAFTAAVVASTALIALH